MSTHNMFLWINKKRKNISTFWLIKKCPIWSYKMSLLPIECINKLLL